MGIDFGMKKIGIAVSDEVKNFVFPDSILHISSYKDGIKKVIEFIKLNNIDELVVGIPYNLKNEETVSTKQAKKFIKLLKENLSKNNVDIPVYSIDEKMTTAMAHKISDNKEDHSIAAYIILSDFFKRRSNS